MNYPAQLLLVSIRGQSAKKRRFTLFQQGDVILSVLCNLLFPEGYVSQQAHFYQKSLLQSVSRSWIVYINDYLCLIAGLHDLLKN